jgi:hypothetical protein
VLLINRGRKNKKKVRREGRREEKKEEGRRFPLSVFL